MTRTSNTVGVVLLIPDPLGSQVVRLRARLGDVLGMAIPAHVTLLPPTVVDAQCYEEFQQHLARVAGEHRPVRIEVVGTGTFRPVSEVVFLAIDGGAQACTELNAAVCAGPVSSPSAFPFHPHITLAHDLVPEVLDQVAADHREVRETFTVPRMCLYELDDEHGWQVRQSYPFAQR
ncbi:MAG: 2'-5' RNA ligase family protein [Ornithinimicrobium sp.]